MKEYTQTNYTCVLLKHNSFPCTPHNMYTVNYVVNKQ